jgi:hypothetical protein
MTTIPEGWKLVRREVYDALAAGLGHVACLYFGTAPAAPEGAAKRLRSIAAGWRLRAVSLQETGMMLAPSILKECAEELDAAIDARDPKRTSWYQHEWVTYQVVGFMGGIGDPLLHTDNAPGREPVYVRRAAPPAHTPAPPQTPAAGALCACGQRRPEDCVAATCRYARAFAPPPTAQPPQPGVVLPNASTTQADYTGPTSNAEPPKEPTR